MTDASEALNPGDAGAAEAMEWLDSQEAAPETTPEPEAEAHPEGEQAEEAPSTEEVEETPPEDEAPAQDADPAEDEEPKATVYDNLPDEILADLDGLSDEALDALNKGFMRQADYTRKTQEAAAKRKEAEALEQAATSWNALLADQEMVELMSRAKEMKEAEEPFDYSDATPEEIDQRVQELVEKRLEAQEQTQVQAGEAVTVWQESLVDPMTEMQQASGLEGDDWLAVTERLANHLDAAGVDPLTTVNADNILTWMEPHIAAVKLDLLSTRQAETKAKSKQDAARSARASSPPPTRTSAAAPSKKWKAEKRAPTKDELQAETLKQLADEGFDVTSLGA